ncbi:GspH/FimT family pseudopilin [Vreelandella sulfidaeris]|uniref:GspH/FimT family pseudopilin n=1 Tax=Vreelandella sulfidaeris TaxID=115553 RepID=UPI0035ED8806
MNDGDNNLNVVSNSGFTLLELLITLLLVGIVAAWGLPSFQLLAERTARYSDINRLQSAFTLARNSAISQRSQMTLCPATEDRQSCAHEWSGELMVVRGDKTQHIANDDILRIFPTQRNTQVAYSRGWSRIRYDSLGYTSGFNGSFTICPATRTDGAQGRKLVLSQLGRLRIDEASIDC